MTLLLIIIYIVFIGLGLPDSVFGAAWPAIYPQFGEPVGNASVVTILISSGTVVASFFSARLINKFGTGKITAFSTLLSAISILGFALSNSLVWICLLAFPLGFGAGAIDAALNNYVAVHYKSTHMYFLHSFYGVGVSLSPLLMSFALSFDNNWRLGFRIVFYILLTIAAISFLALPLWKKAQAKNNEHQKSENEQANKTESPQKPITLSFAAMLKIPAARVAWVLFFSSVGLEFICGIWGCTYLVNSEGVSESTAAQLITLYYVGITAGRFVSGLISNKIKQTVIVFTGYAVVLTAIIMLILPLPPIAKGVALLMVGLGNGPTFPNLAYLTPRFFGEDISQSITGSILTACNVGILVMPPLFGVLAQYVSPSTFPYMLAVMFALMLISTIIYLKMPKPKDQLLK